MINNEVRISKSDTLEELRQRTNEISSRIGDLNDISSLATSAVATFTDSGKFILTDDELYFNTILDITVDDPTGYIVLTGSPTIPTEWITGVELSQAGGFSGILVSASEKYIRLSGIQGVFDASEALTDGTNEIPAANLLLKTGETHPVGVVSVYKDGVELNQNSTDDGFRVANYVARVPLIDQSESDVEQFLQGRQAYQGSSLASATWRGTILDCDTSTLRLKTATGSFSATVQIKVEGSTDTIIGADHGDIELLDQRLGYAVVLSEKTDGSTYEVKTHTLVKAVNDIHTDLGDMQFTGLTADDVSEALRELRTELGDHTALTTTTTVSAVAAINELHSDVGNLTLTGLSATDLSAGVRELRTELGNHAELTTTTTTSAVAAINELHSDVGNLTLTGLSATDLSAGLRELRTELGNHGELTTTTTTSAVAAINELHSDIGNMTLTGLSATDLSAGLRELRTELGSHGSLTTTVKTNAVAAINELDAELGTITAAAMGTTASTVSTAIAEHETEINNLKSDKVELTSTTEQLINSDLEIDGNVQYNTGHTFVFKAGSTLDLSEVNTATSEGVTLLLPGSAADVSTFGTALISTDSTENIQGFVVSREASTVNPGIIFNNSATGVANSKRWQLRGLNDAGNDWTDSIVTHYNAKDLIDIGDGLSGSYASDQWSIEHAATSQQAPVTANSGDTVIQNIDIDVYGHITEITSKTIDVYDGWDVNVGTDSLRIGDKADVTFVGGSGIDAALDTDSGTVTFSHTDTSTVSDLVANGRTYVTGLSFDGFGHVTGVSTGTETVVNTNTVTKVGTASNNVTSGDIVINGGGATSVSKDGNTITITSTDTDTNTDTITKVGTADNNYTTGNIKIAGAGATTVAKSGNTITITSTDTNTDTNYYPSSMSFNTANGVITLNRNALSALTVGIDGRYYKSGDNATFNDVYAYNFLYRSDANLKENISTIEQPLEKIEQLRGVDYNWKESGKKAIGLVAQEVEQVLPELVEESDEGKTVGYGQIVALLIEGMKELKQENKELRAQIEEIKDINNK